MMNEAAYPEMRSFSATTAEADLCVAGLTGRFG
jgi:hypothetical protein